MQANRLVVLVGRQWRRGWRRTQSGSRSRQATARRSRSGRVRRSAERRLVERAQIVLLAAEGRSASEIAERVGCVSETARQRVRYEREGLEGLRDRPKSGRPATHDQGVRARLIALACTRPPDTEQGLRRERWTLAELAEAVGMSVSRAQAILAQADLCPHLTEQWVMSELSPEFDAQAADVFATDCGTSVVSAWPARLELRRGGRRAIGSRTWAPWRSKSRSG